MAKFRLEQIEGRSAGFWGLAALIGALVLAALGAAHYMESHGHIVTGMNNQIVWGLPHVFAVFLIVAASGALNVASMASVFGRSDYKPLAPLSGWLAIALLAGGLAILVLDLGRPERLVVAMTHYNLKSIFAWNMLLYNGFFALVAIYLFTMLQPGAGRYTTAAGTAAFAWRLILTTGTGSIFGFLIAREAYSSAVLAPTFIALSIVYGMAAYFIALIAVCAGTGRELGTAALGRLARLQGWFIVVALYLVAVFHLTNGYIAKQHGVERFLLFSDSVYPLLFWIGQIVLGGLVPLAIFWHPRLNRSRGAVVLASLLVIVGGIAQMYVTIIGAQAWPIDLFPGHEVSSSFFDGEIHAYSPSLPELLLGLGGIAIAAFATLAGIKFLRLVPASASDSVLAPPARG